MVTITQRPHERLLREVAESYIREGYSVQIEPAGTDLPEFLRGFRPDMIVKTPEGSIVVEVKTGARERVADYWKGLDTVIKSHPGWRFELVLNNKREKELVEAIEDVLPEDEITMRFKSGEHLADQGQLDNALLVIWSGLEAILWRIGRQQGLILSNQGPAPLITLLLTEGGLERTDYDSLMRILHLRNRAAHGFSVENLDRGTIDSALEIARRLLNKLHR